MQLADLEDETWAKVPETAEFFRCDHRTILRGIHLGEIPAIRVGTTFRVPVAWLREVAAVGSGQPPRP